MRITQECAWCGTQIGVIDGRSIDQPAISHGICPECRGKLLGTIPGRAETWDGHERRRVDDRRTHERRRSSINDANELIIVSRRTWIDGKRRIKVRRAVDRVWLAERILRCAS